MPRPSAIRTPAKHSGIATFYKTQRPFRYITLYAVSRHYGGPEEGGWWYDWWTPVKTWRLTRPITHRRRVVLEKMMAEKHGWKNEHNRFSVLGGDDSVVKAEVKRHASKSHRRPTYE